MMNRELLEKLRTLSDILKELYTQAMGIINLLDKDILRLINKEDDKYE